MKKYRTFLSIFVFYIILNMILFPSLYIKVTFDGISAWALNVLPSILPFIFFTKILTSLGLLDNLSKVFKKLFNFLFKTPAISSFVFFTSIISGYPVGAKMTADLYESGKIKKSDAFKMCSFCSTSGPMFIIGAVGVGMLKNSLYGYLIFISHILGAIFNGIIYRNLTLKNDDKKEEISLKHKSTFDLSSVVLDSALSVICVGTIIAIFFVIITTLMPIFNLFPPQVSSILQGIIEITKGCFSVASSINNIWAVVACSFIISFGGISTIFQSLSMLSKLNMPVWLFILQKFTHALISCLISIILVIII